MSQAAGPQSNSLARSPVIWLGGISILIALAVVLILRPKHVNAPPVLASLESFELQNQNKQPYGLSQMKGHVSIVNFIFTSCADVCPMLTQQMRKIQAQATEKGLDVRLLSVSVDPATDTPDVLKEYAQKQNADLKNWDFVTGPLTSIEKVVMQGFRIALDRKETGDLFDITHGEHFVLVDQAGRIRAYMRASNMKEIQDILANAEAILRSPEAPAKG